jgi:hypothetical protein
MQSPIVWSYIYIARALRSWSFLHSKKQAAE